MYLRRVRLDLMLWNAKGISMLNEWWGNWFGVKIPK